MYHKCPCITIVFIFQILQCLAITITMYRPAGFSDSEEEDGDGFDFPSDKEERSMQSIHNNSEQGKVEVAAKADTWLPISSSMVSSSAHSTLTSSDLVLAIEA